MMCLMADMVDELWLGDRLEVILKPAGEVVMELGATKVSQNLLPGGGVVEAAEVGLELARQNLQGSGLTDAIGSNKAKDKAGAGDWQAMKLEGIGAITVYSLLVQGSRQIDDVDGLEGAFLHTDAASDTELLGKGGDRGGRRDLDAELACFHHGAALLTLLPAPGRLAAIGPHHGDAATHRLRQSL